jgi:hypothetical protein
MYAAIAWPDLSFITYSIFSSCGVYGSVIARKFISTSARFFAYGTVVDIMGFAKTHLTAASGPSFVNLNSLREVNPAKATITFMATTPIPASYSF